MPGLRDAESGRVALELPVSVALVRRQRWTTQLVGAVAAVRNAIALVRLGNALFQISTLQAEATLNFRHGLKHLKVYWFEKYKMN